MVTSRIIIAVRGVGVPIIYTARPQVRKKNGLWHQKALAGKSLGRHGQDLSGQLTFEFHRPFFWRLRNLREKMENKEINQTYKAIFPTNYKHLEGTWNSHQKGKARAAKQYFCGLHIEVTRKKMTCRIVIAKCKTVIIKKHIKKDRDGHPSLPS